MPIPFNSPAVYNRSNTESEPQHPVGTSPSATSILQQQGLDAACTPDETKSANLQQRSLEPRAAHDERTAQLAGASDGTFSARRSIDLPTGIDSAVQSSDPPTSMHTVVSMAGQQPTDLAIRARDAEEPGAAGGTPYSSTGTRFLNLFLLNICSLRYKVNELDALFKSRNNNDDIIVLSEHWLSENVVNMFPLESYGLKAHFCRSGLNAHGGVMISCKNNLPCKDLPKIAKLSKERDCEFCAIEVLEICIVAVYRPPGGNMDIFTEQIEKVLNMLNHKKVYVLGDFNVWFHDLMGQPDCQRVLNTFTQFGFQPLIGEYTRGTSCLDNIFTNCEEALLGPPETVDTGLSDHKAITCSVCVENPITEKGDRIWIRPVNDEKLANLSRMLLCEDWDFVANSEMDTNRKWEQFSNLITKNLERAVPRKWIRKKESCESSKWYSQKIKDQKEHVRCMRDFYESAPSPAAKKIYLKARRKYRDLIKTEKIQNNDTEIKNSPNPMRKMWEIVNKKNKKSNGSGSLSETPSADALNAYFSSAASTAISTLPTPHRDPLQFSVERPGYFNFRTISRTYLKKTIASLKGSNSKDCWNLNSKIAKFIANTLIEQVLFLINDSLLQGIFPDSLKKAIVCPIYKNKGSRTEACNYRPISILPYFSKIYESVMKEQLVGYFEGKNLFTQSQYGYRKGYSTTKAVSQLSSLAMRNFEEKLYTLLTFYDLTKAFDCVDHHLLLKKLDKYGFSRHALRLMASYLSNRMQAVKVGENSSEFSPVTTGVPQGSLLGPILFIVFTNDFDQIDKDAEFYKYADDTTTALSGRDLADLERKNGLLTEVVEDWMAANKLALNRSKTMKMTLSTRDLSAASNPTHVTFLGVDLNPTMTWEYHTTRLCNKLSCLTYLLRSLADSVSKSTLKACYYAHFHSHLTYAIMAWGHASGVAAVFRLQRRAIRIISGLSYREDCRQAFVALEILTVPGAYIFECLKYMYDHLQDYRSVNELHDHHTRHTDNLYVAYTRLTRSRCMTNYWGPALWNCLPNNVRDYNRTKFLSFVKQKLKEKAFYSIHEALAINLGI